jgi:hypothetical protein
VLDAFGQADLDRKKQNQVARDFKSSYIALNSSMTRRTTEIEAVQLKARIVAGLLEPGGYAFTRQSEHLLDMRVDLDNVIER